jgi:hypothetical protein
LIEQEAHQIPASPPVPGMGMCRYAEAANHPS